MVIVKLNVILIMFHLKHAVAVANFIVMYIIVIFIIIYYY